jgi:protein required for attachment to host cells
MEANMEKTWVVVADSSHARIFQLRDPQHSLEELEDLSNAAGRADNRQLQSDSNAQFNSPTGAHNTYQPSETPVEHEVHQFARHLGHRLSTAAAQNKYHQLCLIAAPRFLGLLRESLDKPARKLVVAELDKNFTAFAKQDIEACIKDLAFKPRLSES